MAFAASAWIVIGAADTVADTRLRRQQLLVEFEELRVATDRALDLDVANRDERMQRVRERLRRLQARWSDSPPIPDSEPRLMDLGSRELLVLFSTSEPMLAGGPPR